MSDTVNNNRFFVFSQQQMDLKMQVEGKLSKKPVFGTVIVNGAPRIYTDIVDSMKKVRFADSVIVIAGDIKKIKYKP